MQRLLSIENEIVSNELNSCRISYKTSEEKTAML